MLGCLIGAGCLPCTAEGFWSSVSERMPPALREINAQAFLRGAEFGAGLHVDGETA
jgi:hypothetical protein